MNYISPKYELASIEVADAITASLIQGNNCTIAKNQEGTFSNGTVTQVSGAFDSLVRE